MWYRLGSARVAHVVVEDAASAAAGASTTMMPESELQAARARIVEALRANGDMTGQQLRDALSMPEPQPGYGLGLLGPSYVVGGYDPFTPLLQQLFRLPDSPA